MIDGGKQGEKISLLIATSICPCAHQSLQKNNYPEVSQPFVSGKRPVEKELALDVFLFSARWGRRGHVCKQHFTKHKQNLPHDNKNMTKTQTKQSEKKQTSIGLKKPVDALGQREVVLLLLPRTVCLRPVYLSPVYLHPFKYFSKI